MHAARPLLSSELGYESATKKVTNDKRMMTNLLLLKRMVIAKTDGIVEKDKEDFQYISL